MLRVPQLKKLQSEEPYLYEALQQIVGAVNALSRRAGVDPTAQLAAPGALSSLSVSAANGIFDVALVDNSSPRLGINYFLETDTQPSFATARVWNLGASRNITLSLGNLTLYFRAYSQYLNSPTSAKITYGNPPAAVTGGGPAPPAQQPPQGSGSGGGGGFGDGGGHGFGGRIPL